MSRIEDLEQELKSLREKREEENKVKKLTKQIKSEKFAQTKGGKVFNAIGDLGLAIGKKITTPPKNQGSQKKQVKKSIDLDHFINSLPQ